MIVLRIPLPHEGRFAIVTSVGKRDAMDAKVFNAQRARTKIPFADGEVVWS